LDKVRVENKTAVQNGVGRLIFVALAVLLEVATLLVIAVKFSEAAQWCTIVLRLLTVLLVLAIYSQQKTSAMKMPWIVLMLVLPVLGVTLYLMIGLNGGTWKMRRRYEAVDAVLLPLLRQDETAVKALEDEEPELTGLVRYLKNYSGYPLYRDTDVTYYAEASDAIRAQKADLARAEKFIFLEYHAIEDAEAWQEIRAVLEERVRAGVEVRVFYDDVGSIGFINTDFVKRMEAVGIKCRVFNPVKIGLNLFLNNRDHRKITVIDGKVGFTGGYNLANEYFNLTHPYGYWKDTGIRLEGRAVRSLTATFLEMWNAVHADDEDDLHYGAYLKKHPYTAREKGYVLPYADSPLDKEQVGENVYISLAESAQRYIWYVTPYLILTDEMIHALGLAAKRGVDVRVITPGIPDKKLVYSVTRSYYNPLTRCGVRIYEYTPGFCHCKMCVTDGRAAVCGTINLDYRSLYHHFENACLYINCRAVADTKYDFDRMLEACREVTEQYTTGRSQGLRFGQLVLRLFAPLL